MSATVGSGSMTSAGTVAVMATSDNIAHVSTDSGDGGLVALNLGNTPTASSAGPTSATFNGILLAPALAVTANGTNTTTATAVITTAGLVAGSNSTPDATVAAGAATTATIGSSAQLEAPTPPSRSRRRLSTRCSPPWERPAAAAST